MLKWLKAIPKVTVFILAFAVVAVTAMVMMMRNWSAPVEAATSVVCYDGQGQPVYAGYAAGGVRTSDWGVRFVDDETRIVIRTSMDCFIGSGEAIAASRKRAEAEAKGLGQ